MGLGVWRVLGPMFGGLAGAGSNVWGFGGCGVQWVGVVYWRPAEQGPEVA